ncbi:MAG: gamma carbonic anhydrase family protein [Chloroflexota bacterium]|nr:gamma carbonic anhydrase family protein [Chloroflexota bacterium]
MPISSTAYVAPTALLIGDVDLEAEASVWYLSVVRADTARIVIGERSNIQDGCVVHVDAGVPCLLGRQVSAGHRVVLHGCTIEDDSLVGIGAVVLNHVRVGTGSVIGAGALLPEGMEVPPRSVVLGVPGRVVGTVDDALAARVRSTWEHYVDQAKRHRAGEFPLVRPSGN